MMKHVLLSILILAGISAQSQSVKFAYINTKDILEKVPAFAEAQRSLDELSEKWQKEIAQKYIEIEAKRNAYLEEKIFLTVDIQKKREEEIAGMENTARELQKSRFGVNGELYQKRQELIKPIQDKMYKAIKSVAEDKYTFVFDIAGQSNIMYADPKLDISSKVVKEMGY